MLSQGSLKRVIKEICDTVLASLLISSATAM